VKAAYRIVSLGCAFMSTQRTPEPTLTTERRFLSIRCPYPPIGERTEAESPDLLAAIGLRLTRIVPTACPMCVISGGAEAGAADGPGWRAAVGRDEAVVGFGDAAPRPRLSFDAEKSRMGIDDALEGRRPTW